MSAPHERPADYVPGGRNHGHERRRPAQSLTPEQWLQVQAGYRPGYWRRHGLPVPFPTLIACAGLPRLIRYVQGESIEEIAAAEGRSPATVKHTMQAAARRLAHRCLWPLEED